MRHSACGCSHTGPHVEADGAPSSSACPAVRGECREAAAGCAAAQTCHKCNEVKAKGEFYRNRTNRDGLYNNCKACFTANSARRQKNLPHIDDRMADSKARARRLRTAAACWQERPQGCLQTGA